MPLFAKCLIGLKSSYDGHPKLHDFRFRGIDDPMICFFLFVAALTAFSLSVFCGGGAGLLVIPILGYSLPLSQVPAALTLGTATSSFSRIWIFFNAIRWDMAKLFLPTAMLGVIFRREDVELSSIDVSRVVHRPISNLQSSVAL